MSSLPEQFHYGSASSSSSVMDAIASYRRAQYFPSSNVPTNPELSETGFLRNEAIMPDDEEDEEAENWIEEGEATPRPREQMGVIGEFEWDETNAGPLHSAREHSYSPSRRARRGWHADSKSTHIPADEVTPLLHAGMSSSNGPFSYTNRQTANHEEPSSSSHFRQLHLTTDSKGGKMVLVGGKSTYGQTLFNAIATLLGIGMLSEPLAFACAGWMGGTFLIIFYGYLTCYTAKILAHVVLEDPCLRSYADIGRKAFGPRSNFMTSTVFCVELFSVSVLLVTLTADSINAIMPTYSADTYKIWCLFLLIPTAFLPLSILSFTSILGILSIVLMLMVIVVDGFSKRDSPGSLWSPAETSFLPANLTSMGVSFGLFMAGFSGHAVIPSLARDMVDPTMFDHMIHRAYIIATAIYAVIGYVGYLMFGRSVSDEFSKNLLATPGYNTFLNQTMMWMLVISPLSKFALATRPLNVILEIMLGLDPAPPPASPEEAITKSATVSPGETRDHTLFLKRALTILERVLLPCLSVTVSIMIPEFSAMMAFLGSCSAFLLCAIGPLSARIALVGKCSIFDGALLSIAICMAVWGTVAAFYA